MSEPGVTDERSSEAPHGRTVVKERQGAAPDYEPVDYIGDPAPPQIKQILEDTAKEAAQEAPAALRNSYVRSAVLLKRNRINAVLALAYRTQRNQAAVNAQQDEPPRRD